MRKGDLLFISLLAVLLASCGQKGMSVTEVKPHVVYDVPDDGDVDQYLFVFVWAGECDGFKSMDLSNKDGSLRWRCRQISKAADGMFFSVFSPAPSSVFSPSEYLLTLADFYGGSMEFHFYLRYDESMASLREGDLPASGNFMTRYAYFGKEGRLEAFDEVAKDAATRKAHKDFSGRRLCCVSPDGGTVCLFPYRAIKER